MQYPDFAPQEDALLLEQGFSKRWPGFYMRYKHTDIENMIFRSKVEISIAHNGYDVFHVVEVYRKRDMDRLCGYRKSRKFRTVREALDWCGPFIGIHAFSASAHTGANALRRAQNDDVFPEECQGVRV